MIGTPFKDARQYMRTMRRDDIDKLCELEQELFDYPWRRREYLEVYDKQNIVTLVYDKSKIIHGILVFEYVPPKINILNIAIAKNYQRQRLGTQLTEMVKSQLVKSDCTKITVHVRENNLNAQLFFRHLGFLAISIVADYYTEINENSYLFEYYK